MRNILSSKMLAFIFLIQLFLCGRLSGATTIEALVEEEWKGTSMYLSVDRKSVQDVLEHFHLTKHGPKLYLPAQPPFPEVLTCDQHVIYISVGTLTSHGFVEDVNLSGPEFGVTIPFLCDNPDGIPEYSFTLFDFYESNRPDFPKVSFAFPSKPADTLVYNDTDVVLRNGEDELHFHIDSQTDPCQPPRRMIRHEFEEYFSKELQLGASNPDFGFCDRHQDVDNCFCSKVRDIAADVHKVAPNVCQTAWTSKDQIICNASIEITTISPGFRSLLLESKEGPITIVSTISAVGNYTFGLKYPCVTY